MVDSRKKDREIDPIVYMYDGVVLRYPSWTTEEVGRHDSMGPGMITNGGWVMNISSLANMP